MPAFSFRRLAATATAAALIAVAAPQAAAAPASDEHISREQIGEIPAGFTARKVAIPMACRAKSPISVGSTSFTISRIFATAVAPEKSVVGQTQPIRIMVHPLNITVPDLPLGGNFVGASRISIDLRIPDGLTIANPRVESAGGNVGGFTVFTVNDAGAKDPAGRILRLAGADNATVGHSPDKSQNTTGGAAVPAGEDGMRIVLPSIVADVTPTTEGAKKISLNTKGAAGNFNDPHNFMTLLFHVTAPVVGDVFVPVMCSPRKNPESPLHPAASSVVQINAAAAAAPPDDQPAEENPEATGEQTPQDENEAAKPEETTAAEPTEAAAEQTPEEKAAPVSSSVQQEAAADDSASEKATETTEAAGSEEEEAEANVMLNRILLVPLGLIILIVLGIVLVIRRRKNRSGTTA